ncbi:MAG: serine/threonine-protein kinase [Myxococcota bacterium]
MGRWTIRSRLGRGAVATVYMADDEATGERVALKALHADPENNESRVVDRLKREIKLAQRVDHPGVCRALALEEVGDVVFLTMELIPGSSLQQILDAEKRIDQQRIIEIIRKVCHALTATHALDILHRDLKPGNIMLRPNDEPSVLDFGFAVAPDVTRVTKAGDWVGTLSYAAPELLKNETATEGSDVYSLGIVLYQCLTGELPFRGKTYGEIASAILYRDPQPLREHLSTIDAGLEQTVLTAIERDPAARFQNAVELEASLAAYDAEAHAPTRAWVPPVESGESILQTMSDSGSDQQPLVERTETNINGGDTIGRSKESWTATERTETNLSPIGDAADSAPVVERTETEILENHPAMDSSSGTSPGSERTETNIRTATTRGEGTFVGQERTETNGRTVPDISAVPVPPVERTEPDVRTAPTAEEHAEAGTDPDVRKAPTAEEHAEAGTDPDVRPPPVPAAPPKSTANKNALQTGPTPALAPLGQPETDNEPPPVVEAEAAAAEPSGEGTQPNAVGEPSSKIPPAASVVLGFIKTRQRLTELSAALIKERNDKGIVAGDNTTLDRLEKAAQTDLSSGRMKETISSLQRALDAAKTIVIDRPFVEAKIERLDTELSDRTADRKTNRGRVFLDTARAALEIEEFEAANRALNQGLELLRGK